MLDSGDPPPPRASDEDKAAKRERVDQRREEAEVKAHQLKQRKDVAESEGVPLNQIDHEGEVLPAGIHIGCNGDYLVPRRQPGLHVYEERRDGETTGFTSECTRTRRGYFRTTSREEAERALAEWEAIKKAEQKPKSKRSRSEITQAVHANRTEERKLEIQDTREEKRKTRWRRACATALDNVRSIEARKELFAQHEEAMCAKREQDAATDADFVVDSKGPYMWAEHKKHKPDGMRIVQRMGGTRPLPKPPLSDDEM